MLTFSADADIAEKQMRAIIFYLTTFGYIDGDFDVAERSFVRSYIEKLVTDRVLSGAKSLAPALQQELSAKYTAHFHEVFEGIDTQVRELFTEAVSRDEDQDKFVHAKLKLRCFEIFQSFDRPSQEQLMETIDVLIMADGEAHPAEVKFRAELSSLLESELSVELVDTGDRSSVTVTPGIMREVPDDSHPFFEQFEHHYSRDPEKMGRQLTADIELIERAQRLFEAQRIAGRGLLEGKRNVSELAGMGQFLDGHVYVCAPEPGRRYDLTVLGDLHGCYSCLKAAISQARFFEKVAAFRADPDSQPEPKLVLLGDYIDRGIFSLNGVLRTVLLLALTAPEHVIVLRGNHEYFVEFNGTVYGGVKPSEAIDTLKPHVSADVFRAYMKMFEGMPSVYLFDRTMFVHAGIPRDRLIKERFKDLSSLNDPDMRFQMMWSDPSSADVIPLDLQDQSSRFAFGKLQAARFLQKIGCHALVRGHEKVNEGFQVVYDEPGMQLVTLFSSGGKDNDDLPANSSYRQVTPMALTIAHENGASCMTPWPIEYRKYNDPERNGFFQSPPELRFGVERGPRMAHVRGVTSKPSELPPPRSDEEVEQAEANVRGILRYLGEDPDREGLLETPARVVRAMAEHFSGYGKDPGEYLARTFQEVEGYDELVLVSDIELFSHCEHHMVPFVGKAHVAYIPNGRVVGLSKLARVVDVFARRLQVQEKLTKQIADAIQTHLEPQGVAVILQCQHFCMCFRGVKKPGSWTTTSKLHGLFLKDSAARMELLTLIGMKRGIGGQGA